MKEIFICKARLLILIIGVYQLFKNACKELYLAITTEIPPPEQIGQATHQNKEKHIHEGSKM